MSDLCVKVMQGWLGLSERKGDYEVILNLYNNHKPLARNYKIKKTDNWCAATISACAIACGCTDIIPTECSCGKMIELLKEKNEWVELDNFRPSKGDLIFYDWQDTGLGDNKGWADHVGMVEELHTNYFTVIEGNYHDGVTRRYVYYNNRFIRGYGHIKYSD